MMYSDHGWGARDHGGQTAQVAEAILVLRPRWKTAQAVVDFIDTNLRPDGYRLVGEFEHASEAAASAVGFWELWSVVRGHYLYVDVVITVPTARGHGYADALMQWVIAEAQRRNCEAVHLDSGVGSDRGRIGCTCDTNCKYQRTTSRSNCES